MNFARNYQRELTPESVASGKKTDVTPIF